MESVLNELNDIQKSAVENIEGPILILAGAGSGKTKVVTTKIAYLIEEKKVHPQEILAFTFTNKAASEMKERVAKLLDFNVSGMWIGTFHSICVRILRRDLNLPGYSKNFSIYDTSDQKTLLKDCLKKANLDEKIFSPKFVQEKISSMKNEGISPDEFEKFASNPIDKSILDIYRAYQNKLVENNAFDFDDLIIKTIELLKTDKMARKYYQERFRYVFVDEYQDTNNIQYELIKLLTGIHNNLCVVGDSDQSIYKWRGANINNILNFEKDFIGAQRIILSQNYRSTKNILNTANEVIKNNNQRIKKDLWTANEEGSRPKLFIANNNQEEAVIVADKIERLINEDCKAKDIAILYRSNSLSRSFEEELMKRRVPYKVIGGIKFYDRAEIKDLMAYLKLIVNSDDDISFRRVINSPKRGIGDVTVEKINQVAVEKNISLFKALSYLEEYDKLFNANAQKKLNDFKSLVENLQLKASTLTITELLDFLLERIEYVKILEEQNTVEAKSKIENIEEFRSSIEDYEKRVEGDLHEYLTGVALLSDNDKTEDIENSVSLITVHSAKGLEFEKVFLVALEQGIFPSAYALEDDDLEEERRLMYVAITRAKKDLYLTCAKSRNRFGKNEYQLRSIFLDEIENSIDQEDLTRKTFIPKESKFFTGFESYNPTGNRYSNKSERDKASISINTSKFKEGDLVNHKKWGRGIVEKVDQSTGDQLVTVQFDSGQKKNLLVDLAPMEVIND